MKQEPAYRGLNVVHRKRIQRFEQAVRDHEMKGAQHPSLWKDIEVEYEEAKIALADTFIHLYNRRV